MTLFRTGTAFCTAKTKWFILSYWLILVSKRTCVYIELLLLETKNLNVSRSPFVLSTCYNSSLATLLPVSVTSRSLLLFYFKRQDGNRMRKFLSFLKMSYVRRTLGSKIDRPWLWTEYRKEVIASDSWTMASLKSFLTASARFSLLTLRRSLCTAIVGDDHAIPGRDRILWLKEELKEEGVFNRWACRYACKMDSSKLDQFIFYMSGKS